MVVRDLPLRSGETGRDPPLVQSYAFDAQARCEIDV